MTEKANLTGRRALITGGAGHVGRAVADVLAGHGADVVLADLARSRVHEAAAAVEAAHGVDARGWDCNLEDEADRAALCDRVADLGPLDVLIHTAALVGTTPLEGWCVPFEEQSVATWRRALEVNVTACFDLCSRLSGALGASEHGSVVAISSIYGQLGPDMRVYDGVHGMGNPAAYGASKAGLEQLVRYMSTVLAPRVRCNSIALGGIARGQDSRFVREYERRVPLGRMGTEGDVRGAALFFASDMSAYITGQTLLVDGGYSAW